MDDCEIVIRGEMAAIKKPDGTTTQITVARLLEILAQKQVDIEGLGLPREARFAYTRGKYLLLVCEYPPGPHTLSWISDASPSPYGPEAIYREVTVSLPYVVVLAVFEGAYLSDFNECYFRRKPLDVVDQENDLLFPGLLNCSRFKPPEGHPLSWICTQHLDRTLIFREVDKRRRIAAGVEALRRCLFEQSFNLSSDHNEYSSWWSESRAVDQRVGTVDRWQEETAKDRFMGLDVPWLDTNENLKSIVDRIFQNLRVRDDAIRTARQLTRWIINHEK